MHIFHIMNNFQGSFWKIAFIQSLILFCCIYDRVTHFHDFSKLFGIRGIFYYFLKAVKRPVFFCAFCQFCSKFIAWCTCPCILSFLPLASLPRTRSTHSTCTLGSAWEIWNGYSNCSAWLDWDIDETADCPYPGSINGYFWGILRIFIHLQDPPLRSHTCVCLCVHALICASEICVFCVQFVSLCRWRTCRASTIKEWKHGLVTAFFR